MRLKKLVDDGVFEIQPDPESTISHRYVLTPQGEELCVILVALWQWGARHRFAPGELKHDVVDVRTEQPLADMVLAARDGRAVGPREFRMATKAGEPRSAKREARAR